MSFVFQKAVFYSFRTKASAWKGRIKCEGHIPPGTRRRHPEDTAAGILRTREGLLRNSDLLVNKNQEQHF